jgi:hypothetical protein
MSGATGVGGNASTGTGGNGAGTGGAAGGSSGTAGSASSGTGGSAGGATGTAGSASSGTGGAAGNASGTGGAGGATTGTGGSADGGTAMDAAAGSGGVGDASTPPFDAVGRTQPTCKTMKPSPIPSQKPTNECDYLLQSLDFEDKYNYVSPQIEITNFGTALGLYAINNCSPYCYSKELTIGVDIVGGGDPKALQGEVIVHFPTTGPELPIATAVGRDSLAWIQLGGDAAPPFKIMAQLVVESSTAGIIPAKNTQQVGFNDWLSYQNAEFKYFGITGPPNGPFGAVDPVNIVGMGFRIMAPANLPKGMEWHGVVYIDHMEMRKGPENMPPGTYPYGL